MSDAVADHYTSAGLLAAIEDGLTALGKDPANLTPEDLAPVDEFHVRGRLATVELAERLGVGPEDRVLDIGSGLGGASRFVASTYGCRVSGIDLTPAFCDVATALAGWVGLAGRVDYRPADALDMPFEDSLFDAAYTQHVAMNIADKGRLYGEARRILKAGGRLAIYDVLKGPGGDPLYPVPWAPDRSISFLATAADMRTLLRGAGFDIVSERDTTQAGLDWFEAAAANVQEGGPPALGIHLILGADFPAMAANMRRNLDAGRIALGEFVCRAA